MVFPMESEIRESGQNVSDHAVLGHTEFRARTCNCNDYFELSMQITIVITLLLVWACASVVRAGLIVVS